MKSTKSTKENSLANLKKWLTKNKKIDLKTTSLSSPSTIEAFNWKNLEDQKEQLLPLLKAYQRLLKMLPDNDQKLILSLLKADIHSAIQVASMSRQHFITTYNKLFAKTDTSVEAFYDSAVSIKSRLLLKHVRSLS